MADDFGSDTSVSSLAIKFGFTPDKKSESNMKKSFAGMTSLISDLAIITKVAGDALGKIWDLGKQGLKIGIEQGTADVSAGAQAWDATEARRFRNAMTSATGTEAGADKILSEIHMFTQAFTNKSKDFAAPYIEKMQEMLARDGVSEDQKAGVINALESGDQQGALDQLVTIIGGMGDEAYTFAQSLGLGQLGLLAEQNAMDAFTEVMNKSTGIYNTNTEVLVQANAAMEQLKASTRYLATELTGVIEGPLSDFANWFEIFVQQDSLGKMGELGQVLGSVLDTLKNKIDPDSILGRALGVATDQGFGDEKVAGILDTMKWNATQDGSSWGRVFTGKEKAAATEEFNSLFDMNFQDWGALTDALAKSQNSARGAFDNEQFQEKLILVLEQNGVSVHQANPDGRTALDDFMEMGAR